MKLASINRSQNATDSSQRAALEKVVKQLKDCAGLIVKGQEAKKKAVKIVNDYLATVPRGEKDKVRVQLCAKAGIDRATFFRWQDEVKEEAKIGDEVRQLAAKHNRVINTPLRKAILDVRDENPEATAEKVFEKALEIVDAPRPKVEAEPIESLTEAVANYLRKTNDDADGLLQVIKDAAIPREKICTALKGLCR